MTTPGRCENCGALNAAPDDLLCALCLMAEPAWAVSDLPEGDTT